MAEKIDVTFQEEVKILEVSEKDFEQEHPENKAKVQNELKLQLDLITDDLVDYYVRNLSGKFIYEQQNKQN